MLRRQFMEELEALLELLQQLHQQLEMLGLEPCIFRPIVTAHSV